VVCLDPLEWLRAGLVTNPGVFVLGQPGVGKSTIVKRLITGMAACGTRTLILGDTKPDYTRLVEFSTPGDPIVAAWTGSPPWTPGRSARPGPG
jgi:Ni2+-binding GTPase involved in maturation of urease and hydrogenase